MERHTRHRTDESTGQTITADSCPDCDGRLVTDSGETRCRQCGLIVECGRLDRREERVFPDDERTERTGAPLTTTRHDRGLSTEIGRGTDSYGRPLSDTKQRQLRRLRREHSRAKWQSKADRNLAHGLSEIARLTSELSLSRSLREQASQLFRTAQDADLLVGRSIESMAAGCVYAVCRLSDATRTRDEISAAARVSDERVTNAYRTLNTELELPTPPQAPSAFLPGIATAVDVSARTERRAHELASTAHDQGLTSGKHPAGFAAACLAVAAEETGVAITQQALADAADVSAATVRAHRDTLRTRLD